MSTSQRSNTDLAQWPPTVLLTKYKDLQDFILLESLDGRFLFCLFGIGWHVTASFSIKSTSSTKPEGSREFPAGNHPHRPSQTY
jgi:hypothetical protein